MKATGIVRRIDDAGRVVIPKEIRRTLRIREATLLNIYRSRREVILKVLPYRRAGDFAREYADSLHDSVNHITCISDRDAIIAVAGAPKKEYMDKSISPALEKIMDERKLCS